MSLLAPSSAALTRPARVSGRDEACPCPLSDELGSAGVASYWSCQGPAHLIKSRSWTGSFTGPIKHCSWPLQHAAGPGTLSLPRPGRTSFFLEELISQIHKITRNAMGVCALKDLQGDTSGLEVGVKGEVSTRQGPQACPSSQGRPCADEHFEPIISLRLQNSPIGEMVLLAPFYRCGNRAWGK